MSTTTETPETRLPATDNQPRQPSWLTVMVREIMVKLTDRAFIIGTITTLLLVVAAGAGTYLLNTRSSTMNIAAVGSTAADISHSVASLASADDERLKANVTEVADQAAGEQLVRDGDADVLVQRISGRWTLTYDRDSDSTFQDYFAQVLTGRTISDLAERAGTTPQQVNADMSFDTHMLSGNDASRGTMGYFVGLAFAVLFMVSAMVYGMQIAQSVIEEKQSRIVEILVSVIPVRELLAGKVLGNTVLAVGQMTLLLGASSIGVALSPISDLLPNLGSAVGWFLLFFLAGFLALACVWAAAGAMCTRSEDLNQTSQPLVWVLMIAYVAGFAASGNIQVVLSFVPIISSILMPVRLVGGTAEWWEPLIALVINFVFAFLTVLVGERIYRRALLRTGERLSYRQALKLSD